MKMIHCDSCKTAIPEDAFLINQDRPIVTADNKLVNPEKHLCLQCVAYRLLSILHHKGGGALTNVLPSHEEAIKLAKPFAKKDIPYRGIDVLVPTEVVAIGYKQGKQRMKVIPVPEVDGAWDISTLHDDALARIKAYAKKGERVVVMDSEQKTQSELYVENISGPNGVKHNNFEKLLVKDKYGVSVLLKREYKLNLNKIPESQHFAAIWEALTTRKVIRVRPSYGVATMSLYYGTNRKQLQLAVKAIHRENFKGKIAQSVGRISQ